jgi:DNA-binding transcriptional ArsR family regulator
MSSPRNSHGDRSAVSSLRAVAHPLRLRMLSLLTGAQLSAAEVARELGITHANASYHLRVLADAGELVVAEEERIRGGVAKRYRHPWDDHPSYTEGPAPSPSSDEDRDLYVRALAEELVRRSRLRAPGTRQALTDAELWVRPDVWKQVSSLVEEASTLVHAEARPPRTEGTVHVNLTAALFQMADPPPAGPADRRVGEEGAGR